MFPFPGFITQGQDYDDVQGLVFDMGSCDVRAGFAGDDAPRAVFPNVVGFPKYDVAMVGMDAKSVFVGDEAHSRRGILKLVRTIPGGVLEEPLDNLERVLHHSFYNELAVSPEEHPVLVVGCGCPPPVQRLSTMLFDVFSVPAAAMIPSIWADAISLGAESKFVVDCGSSQCSAAPVQEVILEAMCVMFECGVVLSDAQLVLQREAYMSTSVGGDHVDEVLMREMLTRRQLDDTSAERVNLQKMKKKCCFVKQLGSFPSTSCGRLARFEFTRRDKSVVRLGSECWDAPEVLFDPKRAGLNNVCGGVHEMIASVIKKCDTEFRASCVKKIAVFGGTSLLRGFGSRLRAELQCALPGFDAQTPLELPDERKFSAWIGGSIASSLESFQPLWLRREEFDEYGPHALERKIYW